MSGPSLRRHPNRIGPFDQPPPPLFRNWSGPSVPCARQTHLPREHGRSVFTVMSMQSGNEGLPHLLMNVHNGINHRTTIYATPPASPQAIYVKPIHIILPNHLALASLTKAWGRLEFSFYCLYTLRHTNSFILSLVACRCAFACPRIFLVMPFCR